MSVPYISTGENTGNTSGDESKTKYPVLLSHIRNASTAFRILTVTGILSGAGSAKKKDWRQNTVASPWKGQRFDKERETVQEV
jgi:hypothetical protein